MLIAESGATKTEWRYCVDNQVKLGFRTPGFNPNVMSPRQIRQEMAAALETHLTGVSLRELFFYGSGIGGDSQRAIMNTILTDLLPGTRISVEHDLLAAARCAGHAEGVVCIIGTGSNSGYYKGGEVLQSLGGHGYIFGDEGSGADLGKHVIKGLLQDEFPDGVRSFIEMQSGSSIYELKIAVHRDPKPNVRLARLAKYLDEIWHYPEVGDMIRARMLAFLDTTVCRYPDYQTLPVTFYGSISYYFQDFLTEACQQRKVRVVDIRRDPIDQLVAYHLKEKLFS
ncbi:MAG: hypothetical protein D6722_11315 [Bacteroidetes bacterium]|nr:MAG: hypothetical protein D6722_11315 [Bacteroidota bacterium]